MEAMNDIQKIRTQIEQHQAEQEQIKKLFPSGSKVGYDGKEPGCGCNRSKSKEAGA